MSNLERDPAELACTARPEDGTPLGRLLPPRDVPLGGPRGMRVRRTLPQRAQPFVGAWCFADHSGPDGLSATGGMRVAGHPHTGLQTVSWLFEGEVEHRDTTGTHALVRPGELNLMTAGSGIAHSEFSTPGTRRLHGAQLWVALPETDRFTAPGFAHHVPPVVGLPGGARTRVLLGSLAGCTSPVTTFTPLLGAELTLPAGVSVPLAVAPSYEHGVLVDTGEPGAAVGHYGPFPTAWRGPPRPRPSPTPACGCAVDATTDPRHPTHHRAYDVRPSPRPMRAPQHAGGLGGWMISRAERHRPCAGD